MKHLHMIGIEGVGMSALAEALLGEGQRVSGCDRRIGANAQRLAELGASVHHGHDPRHLKNVDLLVISNAVSSEHPEVRTALELGIPVKKRIEVLAELLASRPSLGVTGTHGKTTTTAMLGLILEAGGLDPLVLVGARVPQFGGGARVGRGPAVAEIDESDQLFPRARVQLAVLTNLEDDHVGADRPTYHADLDALKEALRRWLAGAETIVYHADWPNLEELIPKGKRRLRFGIEGGELKAEEIELDPEGSRFLIVWSGRPLGRIHLQVPGRHNVENALAAAAAALAWGLPFAAVVKGLGSFRGTGRRLETVGRYRGALLLDDYAHHPTELRATLEAARRRGRRLRVVFQPHRYLRTQRFFAEFAKALTLADEALVVEVYAAGEPPLDGVDHHALAAHARSEGANARALSLAEAEAYLRSSAEAGDLILSVGAGDVWKLTHALAEEEQDAR